MLQTIDVTVFGSPWSYAAFALVMALMVGGSWHEARRSGGPTMFARARPTCSRPYWPLVIAVWSRASPESELPPRAAAMLTGLDPYFQVLLAVGMGMAFVLALYAAYQRSWVYAFSPFDVVAPEDGIDLARAAPAFIGDVCPEWYGVSSVDVDGVGRSLGSSGGLGDFGFGGSSGSSSGSGSDNDGGFLLFLIVAGILLLSVALSFATVWVIVSAVSDRICGAVEQRLWERRAAAQERRKAAAPWPAPRAA